MDQCQTLLDIDYDGDDYTDNGDDVDDDIHGVEKTFHHSTCPNPNRQCSVSDKSPRLRKPWISGCRSSRPALIDKLPRYQNS